MRLKRWWGFEVEVLEVRSCEVDEDEGEVGEEGKVWGIRSEISLNLKTGGMPAQSRLQFKHHFKSSEEWAIWGVVPPQDLSSDVIGMVENNVVSQIKWWAENVWASAGQSISGTT